jgi:adenosylcobinamide-phosphate guanylyltransferase
MGLTALVMAGGRGTRMELGEEKPLLKVGGKPMIEHVIRALENAERVDDIVVAVSEHTPKTAKLLKGFDVKILGTPGIEYHHDLKYAVRELELDKVLTISADLALIESRIIDEISGRYLRCNKPVLTVLVPMRLKEELGLVEEHVIEIGDKRLTPAGINVIDGRRIDEGELDEEIFVIYEAKVALNINTPKELVIAEHLYEKSLGRS